MNSGIKNDMSVYENKKKKTQIKLSDHFTVGKLLRFTFPSIVMMIFTSIYTVVDGFFVSNFAGKTAFTALNLIYPFLMILGTFGFMFGAGGCALVAKTLGEGKKEKANEIFSMIVYTSIISGVLLMIFGHLFVRQIGSLLGAEGVLLDECVRYARPMLFALPFFMVQMEFQSFFVAAEKPKLGLIATVVAGVLNMVLDWLFIAVFSWGVQGAAIATALSQVVGGAIPLIYFGRENTSLLRLGRWVYDGSALFKTCTNGMSEFATNISLSVVSMFYNLQLLKYAGEDGVAAYGVLMYVCMVFLAIFIGYSVGSSPVIGYHYGAGNHGELKGLFKKSMGIIIAGSVGMLILALVLASPLARIFVGYDQALLDMTVKAFYIYSWSFLFCGVGMFGSAFFTALNDGPVSAALSFLRTFVFQVAAVFLLPVIWGLNGIWAALVVAEVLAAIVSCLFFGRYKEKYHYL